jgi:hypothetical protein
MHGGGEERVYIIGRRARGKVTTRKTETKVDGAISILFSQVSEYADSSLCLCFPTITPPLHV